MSVSTRCTSDQGEKKSTWIYWNRRSVLIVVTLASMVKNDRSERRNPTGPWVRHPSQRGLLNMPSPPAAPWRAEQPFLKERMCQNILTIQ